MATTTKIAPPQGFVLDKPQSPKKPPQGFKIDPPQGFVLDKRYGGAGGGWETKSPLQYLHPSVETVSKLEKGFRETLYTPEYKLPSGVRIGPKRFKPAVKIREFIGKEPLAREGLPAALEDIADVAAVGAILIDLARTGAEGVRQIPKVLSYLRTKAPTEVQYWSKYTPEQLIKMNRHREARGAVQRYIEKFPKTSPQYKQGQELISAIRKGLLEWGKKVGAGGAPPQAPTIARITSQIQPPVKAVPTTKALVPAKLAPKPIITPPVVSKIPLETQMRKVTEQAGVKFEGIREFDPKYGSQVWYTDPQTGSTGLFFTKKGPVTPANLKAHVEQQRKLWAKTGKLKPPKAPEKPFEAVLEVGKEWKVPAKFGPKGEPIAYKKMSTEKAIKEITKSLKAQGREAIVTETPEGKISIKGFTVAELLQPSRWVYALDNAFHRTIGKHLDKWFFKAIEKITPRAIKENLVYGYKWKNIPGYDKLRDMLQAERAFNAAKVQNLTNQLRLLSSQEMKQVRSIMEFGEYPDTKVGQLAKDATDIFFNLGKELVEYNILTPAQFEKYAGKYYPYFYKIFEKDGKMTSWFKKRLDLSYAKPRKDLSEEWRQAAGIIDDTPYAIAKRMIQEFGDVALQKFFTAAAQIYGANTQLPNYVQLPKSKKLGALSEKFVPKEIAGDLQSLVIPSVDVMDKIVTRFLALYKMGKVPLNPPTVFRNIYTNFQLADWAGAPPEDVALWVKAAIDLKNKGPAYKTLLAKGRIGVEFYPAEIQQLLQSMQTEKNPITATTSLMLKMANKAGEFYSLLEQWSKIAVFMENAPKIGIDAAADLADDAIFDYAKVAPLIDQLRRGTSHGPLGRLGPILSAPFITFQSKVLPRAIHTMFKRPFTFMKWKIWGLLLATYAAKKLGLSMEDVKRMKRRMQKSTGRIVNLLPKEIDDKYFFLDTTFIDPMGNFIEAYFRTQQRGIAGLITSFGLYGNPFLVPAQMIANQDFYFNQKIVDKTFDSPLEMMQKQFAFMFNALSPTFFTKYGIGRILDAIRKKPAGYGARAGMVEPLSVAIQSRIFGLKQIPYSKELEAQRRSSAIRNLEIQFGIKRAGIMKRKDISDKEKQKQLKRLRERFEMKRKEQIELRP